MKLISIQLVTTIRKSKTIQGFTNHFWVLYRNKIVEDQLSNNKTNSSYRGRIQKQFSLRNKRCFRIQTKTTIIKYPHLTIDVIIATILRLRTAFTSDPFVENCRQDIETQWEDAPLPTPRSPRQMLVQSVLALLIVRLQAGNVRAIARYFEWGFDLIPYYDTCILQVDWNNHCNSNMIS